MDYKNKRMYFLLSVILSAALLCHFPAMADENQTLCIALYVSGGTLEQEYGLMTDDLMQVVHGAKNLSERVTICTAWGGADKPGWRGMTIAGREELAQDLADGTLGDSNRSSVYLPDANMGDPRSLSYFLAFIKERYHPDRIYLIFIGHGQAYTGMLFDQNHGNDGLTIGELVEALKGTDIDLIGFDSCLMGCLEVLAALSPSASFLIASEEAEPADGWPYQPWIAYISAHPDAPVEEIAHILEDEYMKSAGQTKTIALLNPKEADFLTARLDRFAKDLHALIGETEGCDTITRILSSTQQFGRSGTGELNEATMDLYSFADEARRAVPYLEESASGVIEGINRTVIFARHDPLVPDAHGIAILSPVLINPVFYEYYRESAYITPSWDRFLMRYLTGCQRQTLSPAASNKEEASENETCTY